jgi:hypothetical protein
MLNSYQPSIDTDKASVHPSSTYLPFNSTQTVLPNNLLKEAKCSLTDVELVATASQEAQY